MNPRDFIKVTASVAATLLLALVLISCNPVGTAVEQNDLTAPQLSLGPPPPQDLRITEELVFEIPLPVAQSPPPPTSMSLKGMASEGTGTWEATEPFVDGGAASEAEVVIGGRTVHTNTTLQGPGGSIEIDARFHFVPGSSTAEGNFIIVGGTGGYENLHGSGTVTSSFTLEFIPPASLLLTVCNTLEGRAFFTP